MDREGREALEGIEAEIRREKAEALGRAGERLEGALRRLEQLRAAIEARQEELRRGPLDRGLLQAIRLQVEEYNALRERAVGYYQALLIQREAVGFRRHPDMERLYRIPDPIPWRGKRG